MTNNNNNIYKPFSVAQINELTAIYDDFLCAVRLNEHLLKYAQAYDLAYSQLENMALDEQGWPWLPTLITKKEKQQFDDFIDNNTSNDETKVFVILRHIDSNQKASKAPFFTAPPFVLKSANMELPSAIERCHLGFSKNATLGDVEFIIGGYYKLIWIGQKRRDEPIINILKDQDLYTQFCVSLHLAERLAKSANNLEDDTERVTAHILSAEMTIKNENVILETMASFVEKFQSILRDRYNLPQNKKDDTAFLMAQEEGLIHSAKDFQDYINIRNFIRHQWDTLDGFGCFGVEKSAENVKKRADYAKSYLTFCDVSKTTNIQREKIYVNALHQMQHIIRQINPNRIIREIPESNSKFVQRAKAVYAENKNIEVELNRPLLDDKHYPLSKAINKLLPNVKIIDDKDQTIDKIEYISWYLDRSCFLEVLLSVECELMRHCLTRGHDLQKLSAWKYAENIGILSHEEFLKWQKYILLRNQLSHNYFDENLREKLREIDADFKKDVESLTEKISEDRGPGVRKDKDDCFTAAHKDGLVVQVDFQKYNISRFSTVSKPYRLGTPKKESYPNGVEFYLIAKALVGMKTPGGVNITLYNQSISWDADTVWYKNGKNNGYVFETPHSRLVTDNNLKVVEFIKNGKQQPFAENDKLFVGENHKIVLDDVGRIKKFRFKNANNEVVYTLFSHAKCGYNTILLNDGTNILQSGPEFVITHGGKTMLFDELQDFAASYDCVSKEIQRNQTQDKYR